ncbi:MAG: transcriptional regulator [Proteobacteria bacterium]|nr:MAG: transcriptional regulator [Pseudomonadota bacterium]
MGMPSRATIKKVLKEMDKSSESSFLMIGENATPLERFRFDIQQKFVAYLQDEKLSRKELAAILGLDDAKVSKLIRNRIDEFSTDRLISLYSKINPKLKLKVS